MQLGREGIRVTRLAVFAPEEAAVVAWEHALVEALDSTFRIVEGCLDRWTLDTLDEEIRREDFGEDWVHTRGSVLQRVFSHDVYHCGELSQTLGTAGLAQIDLWD